MLSTKVLAFWIVFNGIFLGQIFAMDDYEPDGSLIDTHLPDTLNDIDTFFKNNPKQDALCFLDEKLDKYEDFFEDLLNQKINPTAFCLNFEPPKLKINLLVNLVKYYRKILNRILKKNDMIQFKEEFHKITESILLSNEELRGRPLIDYKVYKSFLDLTFKSFSQKLRKELNKRSFLNTMKFCNWSKNSKELQIKPKFIFVTLFILVLSIAIHSDNIYWILSANILFITCIFISKVDRDLAIKDILNKLDLEFKDTKWLIKKYKNHNRLEDIC